MHSVQCVVHSVQCVVHSVQCGVWSVFIISYLYSWSWCGLACTTRPSPPAASPLSWPSILGSWAGGARTQLDHAVFVTVFIFQILFQILQWRWSGRWLVVSSEEVVMERRLVGEQDGQTAGLC